LSNILMGESAIERSARGRKRSVSSIEN
jgi:hypothetical protein